MSKKVFILIYSIFLVFVFEHSSKIFADTTTLSPCTRIFSSQKGLVNDFVNQRFNSTMSNYTDLNDYNNHLVLRFVLKDLINVYQHKILSVIYNSSSINKMNYITNSHPIIAAEYIETFISKIQDTFQEYVGHHLFKIRYTPDEEIKWKEEILLLTFLAFDIKKQFGDTPISNYMLHPPVDVLDDERSPEIIEVPKKLKKEQQNKKDIITVGSFLTADNEYLEILLQHILTYYILVDENFRLDPTVKIKMWDRTFYIDTYENPVLVRDFFPQVIDNVKLLLQNRSYDYALSNIDDPQDRNNFLSNIYPNVFFMAPTITEGLPEYVLEQDMLFFTKYVTFSKYKKTMLHQINYSSTTKEQRGFNLFYSYLQSHNDDIFNLKQPFYISSFVLSLENIVNALLTSSEINFSTRDAVDLLLGLYGTSILDLEIDYDTAIKKFGLSNKKDSDANTYFTNTGDIDYTYEFYHILFYLITNDKDFATKLGLKNDSIIQAFKDTLLEKVVVQ